MKRLFYVGLAIVGLAGGAVAAVSAGDEPATKPAAVEKKATTVSSDVESEDREEGCSKRKCWFD